jgi:trehalose 6-phosphate phosphatase
MGRRRPNFYSNRPELLVPPDFDDLNDLAILLDVDGTLLDIAPTPLEVVVPPSLAQTLAAVSERMGGAVALVSGRPIAEMDAFFSPLRLPAIGGHGAEMRPLANGEIVDKRSKWIEPVFKQRLKDIAARHPGVLVEDKGYSIALHYRQAPKQGIALVHDVRHAFKAWADRSFELLAGKAVLEIKLAAFNKGTAVRELMTYPPFVGRAPIFVGDDRTDEDAFKVVPDFHGHAMSVGRRLPWVEGYFRSPAEVRQWLELLSGGMAIASLPMLDSTLP